MRWSRTKKIELLDFLSHKFTRKQKIDAHGLGRVVESGNDKWKKGDLITGLLGWEEYSLVKPWPEPNQIEAVDQFPLSYYLSVLGNSGLTAYAGLFHICKPKKGDKVFVSAAAGSVGNLVGQYAKLAGCYVVGCAGSKKKLLRGEYWKDKDYWSTHPQPAHQLHHPCMAFHVH